MTTDFMKMMETAERQMMTRDGTLDDKKERTVWYKTLAEISGKQPPTCDEAYARYNASPNQDKIKEDAKAFVRLAKAQNFDDALAWLACWDFDAQAMYDAISKWVEKHPEEA
jgi:hypothetical protein